MNDHDAFDAFYKDARDRLLLQTYALTGDLPASRSAVRDTFVVAWHHWRKVGRLPDPESWARPQAWAHAQRRHTARLWHRQKGLDPEVRATLDALGRLPVAQRRVLLLNHLSSLPMVDQAREVGVPLPEAERQLQTATAQFSVHRDVPTTSIRSLLDALRVQVADARWPRPSIIRRSGAARRRTHTLVGVAVAVAAVLVSGTVVTDHTGVRPTLAREGEAPPATGDLRGPGDRATEAPPISFDDGVLLTADQVAARVPGRRWAVAETSDNTAGDGLALPCQGARYADPRNRAALLRTFESRGRGRAPTSSAAQVTELSRTTERARRAYDTALSWYAGCAEPRAQLLSTHEVEGVGDAAHLVVLRSWAKPGWTYVAGVARTGLLTAVTVSRTPGPTAPPLREAARLLAGAVEGVCAQPDAGACAARRPRLSPVPPVPAGAVPAMLLEVDLPPVAGVGEPWVGTEPSQARDNVADTSCDRTDFGRPVTRAATRSFLVPGSRLPAEFGLTQTVGTLPVARAQAFVQRVEQRMSTCADRQLGTDVSTLAERQLRDGSLDAWRVTMEISDKRTVTFLMGIVRRGTAVSQVGFVPHRDVGIGPDAFVSLLVRASERLPEMPPPR